MATANACAGSSSASTIFKGQTNIIVYDQKQKIEHFVRIAEFSSDGKALAFLVPTPVVPELTEVDPKAFDVVAPFDPTRNFEADSTRSRGFGGQAQVLQVKRVAGYVATTLRSESTVSLAQYLTGLGFKISPTQMQWLGHYVQQNWTITAFNVDLQNGDGAVAPVRMSFPTDRPFNPYFVPVDNIGPRPAGLKVFFVADHVHKAQPLTPSARIVQMEANLSDKERAQLAGYLKLPPGTVGASLMAVYDGAFPRPNTNSELYFSSQRRAAAPAAQPESEPAPKPPAKVPPPASGLVRLGLALWARA